MSKTLRSSCIAQIVRRDAGSYERAHMRKVVEVILCVKDIVNVVFRALVLLACAYPCPQSTKTRILRVFPKRKIDQVLSVLEAVAVNLQDGEIFPNAPLQNTVGTGRQTSAIQSDGTVNVS